MRRTSRLVILLGLAIGTLHCTGETVVTDGGDAGAEASTDAIANDVSLMDVPPIDGGAVDASDVVAQDLVDLADRGSTDAPVADVVNTSPCPESPPSSGSCSREGLVCTYGDDPRPGCRTSATCSGGSWQLVSPRCTPLPTDCGSSPPTVGSACTNDGDLCAYTDGTRCTCSDCPATGPACMPGPTPVWRCAPPPSDTRCPRTLPNLGQTCTPDGLACDYDGCGGGRAVQCTGGIWVESFVPCPA